jgi:hypothetical protein
LIVGSAPNGANNGWTVSARTSGGGTHQVTVYAICGDID